MDRWVEKWTSTVMEAEGMMWDERRLRRVWKQRGWRSKGEYEFWSRSLYHSPTKIRKNAALSLAFTEWGLGAAYVTLSLISNTPNCLPHKSYDVSLENLILDQRPSVLSCLLDVALTLWGEILSWSLMGIEGFMRLSIIGPKRAQHNCHGI